METREGWHFEKTFNARWDAIVASIDRLDNFHYPWVWLFMGYADEDASVDCLGFASRSWVATVFTG
jgi:hypothetical protein